VTDKLLIGGDKATQQKGIGTAKNLRNTAETGGLGAVAEKAHLKLESLYRVLSPRGNPAFSNLFFILHGIGVKMTIQPDNTVTASSSIC
jgi:DNA-binding phage protein